MAKTIKYLLLTNALGRAVYINLPQHTKAWYPVSELRKGIEVEMEHTKSKWFAEIIAKNHLDEDRKYYTKLAKIHNH